MKTFSIVTLTLLILVACNSEKPTAKKTMVVSDSAKTVSFSPPVLQDSYYRDVFEYQQEITVNPESRQKKEQYLKNAYFPDNKTLLSFGSARKTHPETKQPVAYALQKRAALLDAKRWASYGMSWIENDYKPDFGKITEISAGETVQVFSFDKGDSLVIVLANKVR